MDWEKTFLEYLNSCQSKQDDASHDIKHFIRVAQTAKQIAALDSTPSDALIILAAAYFHDLVILPKDHPDNKFSSCYSAAKAKEVLTMMHFPKGKIAPVCHAIEAHSYSARITPETIEAKIVQDADRMEALGALGIIRTFYVSGRLGSSPYHPTDLFAEKRPLDDKTYALDHFYRKLFKLPDLLQTAGGRKIARGRTEFLRLFVREIAADLQNGEGGALLVAKAAHEAGAKNRSLADVVDRLLGHNYSFLSQFLQQLKEEAGVL